ncbi:MAG: pyruvate kinase [Thermoflexales bacterium]|nr:pyruvate kinase [Thermoflexales bacterium]
MRTKIVCTIGPACDSEATLRAMIRAGMDVARLNFSHGSHEDHARRVALIRRLAAEEGQLVAVMGDLQGPKFRLGRLPPEGVRLCRGQRLTLSSQPKDDQVAFPHPDVLEALQPEQRVLIDDGAIVLRVVEKPNPHTALCIAQTEGVLLSNKGVSVPGVKLALSALTPKDRADIAFAVAHGLDALALSFVRTADDVRELRQILADSGADLLVVAKIEKPEAIPNLPAIVRESDVVMVARGDLGVEAPPEEVPFYQKRIILTCLRMGKPVITATQMLQSMIHAPQPTRAEASDVANAVLDGTDAVMLSGETAAGEFPVQAVEAMARIAARAETSLAYRPEKLAEALRDVLSEEGDPSPDKHTDAITTAAVEIAEQTGARAIVCATASGFTARMVARHRPRVPIICLTPSQRTLNYSAFMWGVRAVLADTQRIAPESLFAEACAAARALGYAQPGDRIVVTAGLPLGFGPGRTNTVRLMVC